MPAQAHRNRGRGKTDRGAGAVLTGRDTGLARVTSGFWDTPVPPDRARNCVSSKSGDRTISRQRGNWSDTPNSAR